MPKPLLSIYLKDHFAGATVGLELARRTARENAGTELGDFLRDTLVPGIREDRETLRRVMAKAGVSPSRPKVAAAWAVEKLGRLKLNGSLISYSPLSRLLELEGLAAGIEAKRALWLALGAATSLDGFDFAALADRAAAQRARLEEHRLQAAGRAFR